MKHITCPACGERKGVPIVYGLPTYEASQDENIYLGGCCIYDDSPRYYCRNCEHTWGRYSSTSFTL